MSLEEILSAPSGRRPSIRKGRGAGSGKGKTCGHGQKGQTSRSGKGLKPLFEGGQMPLYMRVPKRGFSNFAHRTRYQPITLARALDRIDGDVVSLETLAGAGLTQADERIKLVAGAPIDRKVTVTVHRVTASVRSAIEAAGGTVEELDG